MTREELAREHENFKLMILSIVYKYPSIRSEEIAFMLIRHEIKTGFIRTKKLVSKAISEMVEDGFVSRTRYGTQVINNPIPNKFETHVTTKELRERQLFKSPEELKVFNLLCDDAYSSNEIEYETGLNCDTINKYLKRMEEAGLIKSFLDERAMRIGDGDTKIVNVKVYDAVNPKILYS